MLNLVLFFCVMLPYWLTLCRLHFDSPFPALTSSFVPPVVFLNGKDDVRPLEVQKLNS